MQSKALYNNWLLVLFPSICHKRYFFLFYSSYLYKINEIDN